MKKQIITVLLLLGSITGMAQTERKYVLPKMSRQDLASLKNIIRSSNMDGADAVEDETTIRDINRLLRAGLDSTNIGGVNESDVIKLLESHAYGYQNFIQSRRAYNSFMRLLDIIQKVDPTLAVLANRQNGIMIGNQSVEEMINELRRWRRVR